MADLVAGDGGTRLRVTVKDADTGEAMDLTGHDVTLRYRLNGGEVIEKDMTILDQVASKGKAEYEFEAADVPSAGVLHYEVRLDDGGANQLTSNESQELQVRSSL